MLFGVPHGKAIRQHVEMARPETRTKALMRVWTARLPSRSLISVVCQISLAWFAAVLLCFPSAERAASANTGPGLVVRRGALRSSEARGTESLSPCSHRSTLIAMSKSIISWLLFKGNQSSWEDRSYSHHLLRTALFYAKAPGQATALYNVPKLWRKGLQKGVGVQTSPAQHCPVASRSGFCSSRKVFSFVF